MTENSYQQKSTHDSVNKSVETTRDASSPSASKDRPNTGGVPRHERAAGVEMSPYLLYAQQSTHKHKRGGAHAKPKSKKSTIKRIGIGVLIGLCVVLIGAVGYSLWFMHAIDKALAPDPKQAQRINDQLIPADLNEPFYVLILGSDSREGRGTNDGSFDYSDNSERSDVIILARIDANAKQVTLVSIPRDTPYTLEDGSTVKINQAYSHGGAAESIKAVSELTGADISHYFEIHLSEAEAIVDSLGGIEVDVDRKLEVNNSITGERISIEPGRQTLDGKHAQAFLRARHAYADTGDQDGHRQNNVRSFIEACVHKILNQPLYALPDTILQLTQYITCDIASGNLIWLATSFSGDVTMYSCSGPTEGDIMEQYDNQWLCYRNPEGWAKLMQQVDSGQKPDTIDYAATAIIE